MALRVNWNQGKVASDGLVRVHQIFNIQPDGCQFEKMAGDNEDFVDIRTAESALKNHGYTEYKQCSHCWVNGKVIKIP